MRVAQTYLIDIPPIWEYDEEGNPILIEAGHLLHYYKYKNNIKKSCQGMRDEEYI